MPSVWVNLTDADRDAIAKAVPRLAKKMTHTKIKVSSAKGKGRGLQQWVCARISAIIGIPYVQADDSCEIHSREMGQQGVDIVLRGKALEKFPFSIECKNSEQLPIVDVVKQAEANKKEHTEWMIVHKRKALKDPIVIMSWETFEWIWRS